MITNFVILGKNCNDTIESIRQFPNISAVSVLASPTLLNKGFEKPCDYLVICEAGDTFLPEYIDVCQQFLKENQNVGGVYTDYKIGEHRIFIPSFCRQRLVRGLYELPMNCFVRKNLLTENLFKEDFFLDFTDKYAMYHIAEPLVIKQ